MSIYIYTYIKAVLGFVICNVSNGLGSRPEPGSVGHPGTAALKEHFLDMSVSDQAAADFLKRTLHAGDWNDVEEGADSEVEIEDPCHKRFGVLCASSPKKDLACRLVKVLNRALLDNQVKIGSLLFLTTSSESFLGFLGACLKRPMMQTFLQAEADTLSDRVRIQDLTDSCSGSSFSCITGHTLFSNIAAPSECVTVQIWDYTIDVEGSGFFIRSGEVKQEFTLDPNAPLQVRKPHGKLPFGLRMPKKKRVVAAKNKRRSRVDTGRQKKQNVPAPRKVAMIMMQSQIQLVVMMLIMATAPI